MREIERVDQAAAWVVNTFGGQICEEYTDQVNKNYAGKTVGYIYMKGGTKFFLRFRRNLMSFSDHYPNYPPGGAGFGFNRSEIEWQIKNDIWCMIVRPDQRVYVVNPEEVKEFVRKFNTVKGYFRKREVLDEDEDVLNIHFRLCINFEKWLEGQHKSDFDWTELESIRGKLLRGTLAQYTNGGDVNGSVQQTVR
jgi:hypothetical protein